MTEGAAQPEGSPMTDANGITAERQAAEQVVCKASERLSTRTRARNFTTEQQIAERAVLDALRDLNQAIKGAGSAGLTTSVSVLDEEITGLRMPAPFIFVNLETTFAQ